MISMLLPLMAVTLQADVAPPPDVARRFMRRRIAGVSVQWRCVVGEKTLTIAARSPTRNDPAPLILANDPDRLLSATAPAATVRYRAPAFTGNELLDVTYATGSFSIGPDGAIDPIVAATNGSDGRVLVIRRNDKAERRGKCSRLPFASLSAGQTGVVQYGDVK